MSLPPVDVALDQVCVARVLTAEVIYVTVFAYTDVVSGRRGDDTCRSAIAAAAAAAVAAATAAAATEQDQQQQQPQIVDRLTGNNRLRPTGIT